VSAINEVCEAWQIQQIRQDQTFMGKMGIQQQHLKDGRRNCMAISFLCIGGGENGVFRELLFVRESWAM